MVSISFRAEVPFPRDRRGKATIRALGLDREPLREKRRELLEKLRLIFFLAFALEAKDAARASEEVEEARAILRRAVEDGGEYAAMVRAAIPRWKREYGIQ